MGNTKDNTISCDKYRHLESGTHVSEGEKRLRWVGRVQRRDKDEGSKTDSSEDRIYIMESEIEANQS